MWRSAGGRAPRRDGVAGEQLAHELRVGARRVQRGGRDVRADQRPWGRGGAELVGHQREVDEAVTADGAAAVGLVDEQGRPPQLGAPPPVLVLEPDGIVVEPAELVDGCRTRAGTDRWSRGRTAGRRMAAGSRHHPAGQASALISTYC